MSANITPGLCSTIVNPRSECTTFATAGANIELALFDTTNLTFVAYSYTNLFGAMFAEAGAYCDSIACFNFNYSYLASATPTTFSLNGSVFLNSSLNPAHNYRIEFWFLPYVTSEISVNLAALIGARASDSLLAQFQLVSLNVR